MLSLLTRNLHILFGVFIHFIIGVDNKVMDSPNSYEAKKRLAKWYMMATGYQLPEFNDCFRAFTNWQKEILNSFDVPFTNGYTEGVNNKIKVLKRNAYGIRNFIRFRNRILHVMA